jgi:hypothetical protein
MITIKIMSKKTTLMADFRTKPDSFLSRLLPSAFRLLPIMAIHVLQQILLFGVFRHLVSEHSPPAYGKQDTARP